MIGVEIDGWVLDVAWQHFDLAGARVRAVKLSAQQFLRQSSRRFDAIVDDIWSARANDSRPLFSDPQWARLIGSHLTTGGIYTVTTYRRNENPQEYTAALGILRVAFGGIIEIRPPFGPTTVLAAGNYLPSPAQARRAISLLPPLFAEVFTPLRFADRGRPRPRR